MKQAEEEKVVSMPWQEKRELAQKEEEVLSKDIEDLKTWLDMMENMHDDDQQLKEYLEYHPGDLNLAKDKKNKNKVENTSKSVPKITNKSKSSASSKSNGILASVLRFHKN
ncbi:hypothetical protein JHK85_003599 [Glycine max]|nr:hypothetical protein JHK85_003599 [Glycine max]